MTKLVRFCKNKGFVFAGSEIYGGSANTWDYGPLGVELKNNIKEQWWKCFVQEVKDVVGSDPGIIAHPQVWKSANTFDNFTGQLKRCAKCNSRKRVSNLELLRNNKVTCGKCGCEELKKIRDVNLMFSIDEVGPDNITTYLRTGLGQTQFVNFLSLQKGVGMEVPFGVGLIGKAFRNEFVTGNFLFRTIEFEQMDLMYFCNTNEVLSIAMDYAQQALDFKVKRLGIKKENLRIVKCNRLPHYAQIINDIEYNFCFGWGEICSTGHCGDYDLTLHEKFSGKPMRHNGEVPNTAFISHGADRVFVATLHDAYCEEIVNGKTKVILNLKPSIAPYKVAILPLYKGNKKLASKSQEIFDMLSKFFCVTYDSSQTIENRYTRQDEIGTVFCAVIDFTTLDDNTIAVRNRGKNKLARMSINKLIKMVRTACND